jgi:peptide-methionine (R)-S-oxide reductase
MRQQGTERPFTSPFVQWEAGGVYHCKGCNTPLFHTDHQFDAGCGWPSFDRPVEGAPIVSRLDKSHGMIRTEVRCGVCDSHLGHVFPDGPAATTGERFCINGICLTRQEAE